MSSAILLVAHGSRRQEANADLVRLAEMVSAEVGDRIVEIGYLELASPTIPEGLRKCADRGAHAVSILPYFLSPGDHVSRDLVQFRDEFQKEHPEISCNVCPPIGLHSLLVELLLLRLQEGSETETAEL